ncbi:hypothetical protein C1646_670487 [Rhizophagus diaphanus]|nr:hypothetical protein C1646_670487 [Rhizophagus diaphanus] [Rhizophagus sp. MUCL 43196]
MTGITGLKDLEYLKDEFKGDLVNVFHYKRINLESSLKNENYKVYGSIISENNARLEEIHVKFGQYDVNGFYAIIKKLKVTNIDITKCYISWIIIGIPSQLSVFSPINRELQVDCIKKSIKLQPNEFNYNTIDTCFTLYEGYTVFAHAYHSSTNEPKSIIKLVKWSQKSRDNYLNDTSTDTEKDIINVDLHVCIPLTSKILIEVLSKPVKDIPRQNSNKEILTAGLLYCSIITLLSFEKFKDHNEDVNCSVMLLT